MRILLSNKFYYPWIGGIEKYVQNLAEGLAKHGHEVNAVVSNEILWKNSAFDLNGVHVTKAFNFRNVWRMPISPAYFWNLRKKAEYADILHFQYPFPLGTLSYFLARLPKNKKVVLTFHSEIVRQKRIKRIINLWEKSFFERCDRIIVTSQNLLEISETLRPFRKKCKVIPLGIDSTLFEKKILEVRNMVPVLQKKYCGPLILFVGRLAYYKGIKYAIEAIKYLPGAKLVVVGSGPQIELKILKKAAKEFNVEKRVFFETAVDDVSLPAYYKACDVFVFPSIEISEAFGYAQLEAMAAGKPVVSSNLPTGVSFVNQDGKTGLLVAPRNARALSEALRKILSDEHLHKAFSANALARAKQLSLEVMIRKTEELYRNL